MVTRDGMLAGTAAYMSPEQAEGLPLDTRSDIFSFGAVLYEMVTGERAFQGNSKMSLLTSILRDDPQPLGEKVANVPHELETIVNRCLRKDPARRYQSFAEARLALLQLQEESDSGKLRSPKVTIPNRPVAAQGGAGASCDGVGGAHFDGFVLLAKWWNPSADRRAAHRAVCQLCRISRLSGFFGGWESDRLCMVRWRGRRDPYLFESDRHGRGTAIVIRKQLRFTTSFCSRWPICRFSPFVAARRHRHLPGLTSGRP